MESSSVVRRMGSSHCFQYIGSFQYIEISKTFNIYQLHSSYKIIAVVIYYCRLKRWISLSPLPPSIPLFTYQLTNDSATFVPQLVFAELNTFDTLLHGIWSLCNLMSVALLCNWFLMLLSAMIISRRFILKYCLWRTNVIPKSKFAH